MRIYKSLMSMLVLCFFSSTVLAQEAQLQESTESEATAAETISPVAISLEKPVYFISPSGAVVLIAAGDYRVDAAYGTLVLFDSEGIAWSIQARWEPHGLNLEFPIAVESTGETEADSDYHFVSVLMPGGSGLEAGGTYSGVRPRGLLSAAKEKVEAKARAVRAAAQQKALAAQRAAQQAAQQVAGQVQSTAQQAVATGQQAVATGQQVTAGVINSIGEAIPTREIQQLLVAVHQLGVQDLLVCLANARSDRRANIVDTIRALQSDPANLVFQMQSEFAGNVKKNFPLIAKPGLDMIRTGNVPSTGQIIGSSFTSLNVVMQERPGTKCLADFIAPYVPKVQQGADRMVQQTQERMQNTFNETLMPILTNSIVKGLNLAISSVATSKKVVGMSPNEMELVASGVYSRLLTYRFDQAANKIQAAVKSGDPEAVREAIRGSEAWTNQTALDFGFEMMRIRLRGLLKVELDKKTEAAVGSLKLGTDTVKNISHGVCGLVPEVGAGICSVVFVASSSVWNLVGRRAVVFGAKGAIMGAFEVRMACMAGQLGVRVPPEAYLPSMNFMTPGVYERLDVQKAGSCSEATILTGFMEDRALLNQAIQQIVEDDLPPGLQNSVKTYNTALIALTDQWSKDRRR